MVGVPSLWPRAAKLFQERGMGVIRQDERKAFVNAGRFVVTNPANFLKVRFWQIIDIDRFSAVDPFNTKS
jgi:hypothetical protein